MAVRKPSLIRRFFGFIFLRLVPTLLIVAIVWSGYQVAQAVIRQLDERSEFEGRVQTFPGTATSIGISNLIPTETNTPLPTDTPVPSDTLEPSPTEIPPTSTPTPSPTKIPPTDTPVPTLTLTFTALPTDTELPPTATSVPSINTPLPSLTTIPPLETAESEQNILVPAQFGATNTPRPVLFATNTPVGQGPAPTAAPIMVTNTSAPTEVVPTEVIPTAVPATEIPTPTLIIASNTPIPPTLTPTPEVIPTQPLPTPFFPREGEAGRLLSGTAVPTSVPLVPREGRPLVNIILLGGDDELTGDGTVRTDTMIVVSINRDANSVSMLSLPRDLFVYIPTESGLMERLNVVYGYGENIGWTGGGFGLLRQTILYNFGINVHYYARVNFSGFEQIIDTLGGVDIAVDCAYQDYPLIGAEVPEGAEVFGEEGLRTLNVGYYHMDGAQALWYARTRRNSSDFDRGRRQMQLLRSMWREGKGTLTFDPSNISTIQTLWGQVTDIVDTDLGFDEFVSLIPIALNLDVNRMKSYTLIRTYHTIPWQPPDGSFVQLPVYETMRPLLEAFYSPPTGSQLLIEGATIEIYNGTTNDAWDRVAADRLAYEGFRAISQGQWESTDLTDTILIDYTGQQKGSSRGEIAQILNVQQANIRDEPNAERTADFRVILGSNYNSCNMGGVLPVDQVEEG